MTATITYLYAAVPVVVLIGWVPQIVALFRNPSSGREVSVVTWLIWGSTGLVGTTYSIIVLQDILTSLLFTANLIGQVTMISFAVIARVHAKNRKNYSHSSSSSDPDFS